jgi:hypothetical protein
MMERILLLAICSGYSCNGSKSAGENYPERPGFAGRSDPGGWPRPGRVSG